MADGVTFFCKKCGDEATIENIKYLTTITGLDIEDLKFCTDHLNEALEGITLDLSIGSAHTRSEEFQAQREQRKQQRREGEELAEAKQRETIRLGRAFYDDRTGEGIEGEYGETVVIEMPKIAKEELKELGWQATHRRWDDERQVWLADANRVDMVKDHMESKGWTVEVSAGT